MNTDKKGEKNSSKIARILNNTFSFCIMYMLINWTTYLMMGFIAKIFSFNTAVTYYGNFYDLHGGAWTRWNVFFIFISPLIWSLLFCGIFSFLFIKFHPKGWLVNIVFLWGGIVGFCFLVAQFFFGALGSNSFLSPFYQGLAVVYSWLYFPDFVTTFIALPALALLAFGALHFCKPFLTFAYSYSKVSSVTRKRKYFLETMIYPTLLGLFIINIYSISVFKIMNFVSMSIIYLITFVLFAGFCFVGIHIADIKTNEMARYKNLQTLNPILFIIMFLLMAIFFITAKGFNI